MTGHRAGAAAGSPGRAAGAARLLATVAALVVGQAVLWRAGATLPSIPLDRAGAARTFVDADPLALAVAVVRLVALAAGAGLLVLLALGITARGCGAVRLAVHIDRWTPPSLRRLLDATVGVGLAASLGLNVAPAGADAGDAPPAASTTIRRLPDAPAITLRRLPDGHPSAPSMPPAPSLRRLPDGPPTPASDAVAPPAPGSGAPTAAPAAGVAPADPPAALPPSAPTAPAPTIATHPALPPRAAEVVVEAGGSFWRLAEQHEADRLGRTPTEAEVGACWQELVAVNRHRLVVPDDPDLLFPGQRLILPCR